MNVASLKSKYWLKRVGGIKKLAERPPPANLTTYYNLQVVVDIVVIVDIYGRA